MVMLHLSSMLGLAALIIITASATGPTDVIIYYCNLLASEIPDRISYPRSTTYNVSISSYYSGQESELQPACVFSPTTADEVSQFIKLINPSPGSQYPQFAVRSGGHMIWAGSANIQGGITIDMRSMNSTQLSNDNKVVSLGTGGLWVDAYTFLDQYNLTVMGGRVNGIGIGGLATGGMPVIYPNSTKGNSQDQGAFPSYQGNMAGSAKISTTTSS